MSITIISFFLVAYTEACDSPEYARKSATTSSMPVSLTHAMPTTFHCSRPNLLRRPSKVRNVVRYIVGVAQRVVIVVRCIEDFF